MLFIFGRPITAAAKATYSVLWGNIFSSACFYTQIMVATAKFRKRGFLFLVCQGHIRLWVGTTFVDFTPAEFVRTFLGTSWLRVYSFSPKIVRILF